MQLKNYAIILMILLLLCVVVSIVAIASGSSLIKDSWFLPILLAQVWTIGISINDQTY